MNAIYAGKRRGYLSGCILNAVGAIVLSLASLVFIVIGLTLLSAKLLSQLRPCYPLVLPLALAIFLVVFITGLVRYSLDARPEDGDSLEIDDGTSLGLFFFNLRTLVLTIVFSSSYCLVRAVSYWRRLQDLASISDPSALGLLLELQRRSRERRYHGLAGLGPPPPAWRP